MGIQDIKSIHARNVFMFMLKKADAKRAGKPERKKVLKKVDAKRAGKPERKEVLKKADAKRAGKPERKEVQKKAKKKYLLTPKGLAAKLQENQRQREKLQD